MAADQGSGRTTRPLDDFELDLARRLRRIAQTDSSTPARERAGEAVQAFKRQQGKREAVR